MSYKKLINLNNVSVTYWRWGQALQALVDVNVHFNVGQWVMIVGQNGSGKSTLLKVIAGQQEITHGRVDFTDSDPETRNFASHLFHVCQDPLLGTADELTLLENLAVADPYSRTATWSLRKRREQYLELLTHFDLVSRANQLVKYFSGGERQQVALLIAKLRNPQILLLDEPFSALDESRAAQCLQLIESMNNAGCTIIQITHDVIMAKNIGHRIITLEHGKILTDHFR